MACLASGSLGALLEFVVDHVARLGFTGRPWGRYFMARCSALISATLRRQRNGRCGNADRMRSQFGRERPGGLTMTTGPPTRNVGPLALPDGELRIWNRLMGIPRLETCWTSKQDSETRAYYSVTIVSLPTNVIHTIEIKSPVHRKLRRTKLSLLAIFRHLVA